MSDTILHAENDVEVDVDGKEIRDEFGLWDHAVWHGYNRRSTDMSNAQRHSMVRGLQTRYGAAMVACGVDGGTGPCPGMRWRSKGSVPLAAAQSLVPEGVTPVTQSKPFDLRHRCYGALCPSCWSIAQMKCLRMARDDIGKYEIVYLRQTNLVTYESAPHPALWKAFIANDTRYKLIAWTIGFEEDLHDAAIKFVGLWGAEPVNGQHVPIRESGVSYTHRNTAKEFRVSHGGVRDRKTGEYVGAIIRDQVHGFDHAREQWLSAVGHPANLMNHGSYEPAIFFLNTWLTRSHQVRRTVYGSK